MTEPPAIDRNNPGREGFRAVRLLQLAALMMHLLVAVTMLRTLSGGFPLLHPRTFANRLCPLAMILLAAVALIAGRRKQPRPTGTISMLLGAAWIGLAAASRIFFPISARVWFIAPAGIGIILILIGRPIPTWKTHRRSLMAGLLLMFLAGASLALSQVADPPATHPANEASPEMPAAALAPTTRRFELLSKGVSVQTREHLITFQHDRYMLSLNPMLTFVSRSPDRFWTIFAPRANRLGPPRNIKGTVAGPSDLSIYYQDDDQSRLRITDFAAQQHADIESITHLPTPVYSHLNTFCEIEVAGHRALAVSFSPCPAQRFDVMPFAQNGPGRRVAYLDAVGQFHVAEAEHGDKGPFRELAAGPMQREDPLVLTLFDEAAPIFVITLENCAAQTSTAISPTAGYGLPENAIEFTLEGSSPRDGAAIWITLASTSIGAGWDSVGHAAGVYSNRMRVEWITSPATRPSTTSNPVNKANTNQ